MWIMGRNACDPFSNNDRSAQISKKPTKSIRRANGDQRRGKNQAGKAEIVGQKPDMTTVKSRDDNNKDVSDSDYASLGWGNQPVRMPPNRMIGIIRGSDASLKAPARSRNAARGRRMPAGPKK